MFTLKTIPDHTVEVSIQVPGEETTSTIEATWKLHKWDDFQARIQAMQAGELTDEQLVEEDLINLAGIKNENGDSMAYSPDLAAQLMQLGYVRRPLMASWFEAQQGRNKAAAKNSPAPGGGGRMLA